MRDANRPRLSDFAYGRWRPGRVHVVVRRDPVTRFVIWRGDTRLREFVHHANAMTWARKIASADEPSVLAQTPEPMEAP